MQDYSSSKLVVKVEEPENNLDYRLVKFIGDMDTFGLDSVRTTLEECAEKLENSTLVFDFADLNFINSESIGFLHTIHLKLSEKKKTLVVINATARVKDVLEVIGMFSMIKYFDSLQDFQASLKG